MKVSRKEEKQRIRTVGEVIQVRVRKSCDWRGYGTSPDAERQTARITGIITHQDVLHMTSTVLLLGIRRSIVEESIFRFMIRD